MITSGDLMSSMPMEPQEMMGQDQMGQMMLPPNQGM
jgi:hypothetical protein